MEKWLLVYNCQAPGLKNCIQLLSQEVEVEAYVFSQFQKVADGLKSKFDQYDKIIVAPRSEEHTSELQSLMRISYAVFCLKKKKTNKQQTNRQYQKQTTQ